MVVVGGVGVVVGGVMGGLGAAAVRERVLTLPVVVIWRIAPFPVSAT